MTTTITQTETPSRSKQAGPCWIAAGDVYAATRPREIPAETGQIITVHGKAILRRSTRVETQRREWRLRVTGDERDQVTVRTAEYGQAVEAVLTGVVVEGEQPGAEQTATAPVEPEPEPTAPQAAIGALRAAGWTVAKIAAEVGVHRSSVYRWSHGHTPNPRNAAALALLI